MRRLFVALLVTAIAFVACAGPVATSPSPTASAQATPKPPKDVVTLTGINSTELNLPTLVAIAKDYFGEENIELKELVIGSSGTLRQAMIAKQYDWGLYAFVHVPLARIAGSPFKVIAQVHDQEIFGLVIRSLLKDQAKAVKDLKG